MSECRWIEGDPSEVLQRGDAIYCGKPAIGPERSWCAEHRARCFYRWGEQEIAAQPSAKRETFGVEISTPRTMQPEAIPAMLAGIASLSPARTAASQAAAP